MDDDASSIASAESAADKAPTEKTRSMKAELDQKRIVELAELKATDLTFLSASKRSNAAAKTAKLEAQIKLGELTDRVTVSHTSNDTLQIIKHWPW